jgi:hypothetical protein
MVHLDATKLRAALTQPDGPRRVLNVIMHELGHLVGLAHINDPQQLMHSRGRTVNGFRPGDLAGLARLGDSAAHPGSSPLSDPSKTNLLDPGTHVVTDHDSRVFGAADFPVHGLQSPALPWSRHRSVRLGPGSWEGDLAGDP